MTWFFQVKLLILFKFLTCRDQFTWDAWEFHSCCFLYSVLLESSDCFEWNSIRNSIILLQMKISCLNADSKQEQCDVHHNLLSIDQLVACNFHTSQSYFAFWWRLSWCSLWESQYTSFKYTLDSKCFWLWRIITTVR